jgi:hypothetical protein
MSISIWESAARYQSAIDEVAKKRKFEKKSKQVQSPKPYRPNQPTSQPDDELNAFHTNIPMRNYN